MDALAVHNAGTVLVPRLSELRLVGDVLSGIERVVDFLGVRSIESKVAVTKEVDPVEVLVLATGHFTLIPELIAWELRNLLVVLVDTALNHLVEPMMP